MLNPSTLFASDIHISMPAEKITSIFGVDITNALLYGLIFYALLGWLMIATVRCLKGKSKPNFFTRLVIWIFESLYRTVCNLISDQSMARVVAPMSISIFFFVAFQYWAGVLPIIGPITVDGVPLFRSMVTDLNTTLAVAIVAIVAAQVYAAKYMGFWQNISRYVVNPLRDPIGAFVGVLEFATEFTRALGLSFRLFGNAFAGEVLLVVIGSITVHFGVLALPPFYLFEIFIGTIQAYIFFMLATIFASLGLVSHGGHTEDKDQPAHHTSHQAAIDTQQGV